MLIFVLFFFIFSHICIFDWQKFLQTDILEKELSLETPIYVISEGHEPPFFTCFFEWDPSKANVSKRSICYELLSNSVYIFSLSWLNHIFIQLLMFFFIQPVDTQSVMTGEDAI